MDKRNTQISLPLQMDGGKLRKVVAQHWNITFARQGKISVVAKRIMGVVLGQIQDNDMDLKPYYEMKAADVVRNTEGGTAYEQCKKAFSDLASAVWMIEDLENKEFEPRNILDTTKTTKKDGFKTSYNDGRITIAINPALEDYFIGMAHYTKYELQNYMNFKSWYSMRFWEILSAYKDTGKWYVSLEEYRKLMDCEKKYSGVNMLIKKTLSEPLEELKGTSLEFKYEKVYSKFGGKGRPSVMGLNFILNKKSLSPDQILKEWEKHSLDHEKVIQELQNKWKVTSAVLVKYLPIIKLEGAEKLIKSFEKMEHPTSKRKIDDKIKYCNSAVKKAAMLLDSAIK